MHVSIDHKFYSNSSLYIFRLNRVTDDLSGIDNDSNSASLSEPNTPPRHHIASRPVVYDVLNISQEELDQLNNSTFYTRIKSEPREYDPPIYCDSRTVEPPRLIICDSDDR